jgi:hypothetical protein
MCYRHEFFFFFFFHRHKWQCTSQRSSCAGSTGNSDQLLHLCGDARLVSHRAEENEFWR